LIEPPIPISGDVGVGDFKPDEIRPADFHRLPATTIERLRRMTGVTATASDVLDELGFSLTVSSSVIGLRSAPALIVGHALTVRYLPERRSSSNRLLRQSASRLTHHTVFAMARPGDVVVVEVGGASTVSVFGGVAAQGALRAGIAGCVVDGGIRDLEQIRSLRLPVWSRLVTPRTGKWRVEAVGVNVPIACGGVQVNAGDLVIADETGLCFLPLDVAQRAIERILEVGEQENKQLAQAPPASHAN
jgi:4-hydroxy-4-methyl-2-oxoglutarate aldolase